MRGDAFAGDGVAMTDLTGDAGIPTDNSQHFGDSDLGSAHEPLFIRPDHGRILGGVCAGVAERWSIDVTLVRVVTVVLALLSGVGVVAYVAAWLLTPSGSQPAAIRPGVTPGVVRLPRALGWWRALVAVVIGLLVLAAVTRLFDGDGGLRPRRFAGFVVLALVLLAFARLARLRWARRTAGGALVLLLAAVLSVGVWGQHFASNTVQASSVADLQPSYDQGVGALHLDLTSLAALSGDEQSDIRVGRGDAIVTVPAGVPVYVHARSGLGTITLDGQKVSGIGAAESRTVAGAPAATPRLELDITVGIGNITVTTATTQG